MHMLLIASIRTSYIHMQLVLRPVYLSIKPDHKRIIETKDYEHTTAKSLTLYSPNSRPNPK